MSESDSGSPPILPAELERALQHATSRTLASLVALRKALRQHVRSERVQGISFADIETSLRVLVLRAEGESKRHAGDQHAHHPSLSDQVIKWSEGFFSQID
jgi:hypothetical protein